MNVVMELVDMLKCIGIQLKTQMPIQMRKMKNWSYPNSRVVKKGPSVVMIDDSNTEKQALKDIRPNTIQLLCTFHFLQCRWTWLYEGRNWIGNQDRAILLNLVKLFQFVVEKLECYYQHKLLSFAHNQIDRYIQIKYCGLNAGKIQKEHIKPCSKIGSLFLVKSRRIQVNYSLLNLV